MKCQGLRRGLGRKFQNHLSQGHTTPIPISEKLHISCTREPGFQHPPCLFLALGALLFSHGNLLPPHPSILPSRAVSLIDSDTGQGISYSLECTAPCPPHREIIEEEYWLVQETRC